MNQLTKMASYLLLKGIVYKTVKLINGQLGIMADTDYEGYYPDENTRTLQREIKNKAKQLKLYSESRGSDTAVLIMVR